ncbi:MAG: LAGLIDADG family homing endonuclease [Candidatus Hodarchaeales archaeon]
MAYILGYIFADGSIRTRPSGSDLRIKSKEIKILKSINNSMKSNYPISKEETRTGPLYCLSVNRKKIVFDLLELGLIPKKSKTMTFPWVPERLFYHFIRGVFDGDGHVRILGNSLETIFTSGSKNFLVALHKKLEYQDIKSKVYTKSYNSRKWYYLSIFNESREKFYNKLYKGATLFLRRKYIIFQNFFQNHHNLPIICDDCGNKVPKTGNNQKRCRECRKEYRRELNRRFNRKKKKTNV